MLNNSNQSQLKSITMASNLFQKAKTTAATKTTKSKDEKVRVTVKDSDFFNKVEMLEILRNEGK